MTEPTLPIAPESTAGPAAGTQHGPATRALTTTQKWLLGTAAAAALLIALIGFAGSYHAVSNLAAQKHFGWFANAFPVGIDAGIVAFLALDLVLTWLRMPYPLLRQGAWVMTVATIAFNSAAAWGDWLAVGMHAAIPVLFVIVVEAARHAIGRIADIVADRHIESPPPIRWILSPLGTYLIWRRMRVWQIPSYLRVIEQQRELRVFRAKLRKEHGRGWRLSAPAEQLLVFQLARFGISVSEALAMPEAEAEAQRRAEADRKAEADRQDEAEAEALRLREQREHAEAEARRQAEAEAEAKRRLTELETEAKLAELSRKQTLAEAEAEAELAMIEQRRLTAEAEAEAERRQIVDEQKQAEATAELQRRREIQEHQRVEAEAALRRAKDAEDVARRQAEAEAQALEAAKERLRIGEQAKQKAQDAVRLAAEAEARLRATAAKPKPETLPKAEARVTDPKLETETAKPKQPAQITGRRARVEAEVEAVRELMRATGGDTDLKTVMEKLNLTQTTAWDRLNRARQAA